MLNRIIRWGLLLFLCSMATLFSQSDDIEASKIKYLYDDLRFEEAVGFGHRYLALEQNEQPHDLALIHRYLAFSFFSVGKKDSARKHFMSLLSINPDTELDTVRTSPKIRRFFAGIKENFTQTETRNRRIGYTRYIFVKDLRPGATWRSAILPGWGQFYKNQKKKAYIVGGLFSGAAVFTVGAYMIERNAEQSYLDATQPDVVAQRYDRYNTWAKTRKISTYITAGIWLYAVADALWNLPSDVRISLTLNHMHSAISLSWKLH